MVVGTGIEPVANGYQPNILPIKLTYNSGWRGEFRNLDLKVKSPPALPLSYTPFVGPPTESNCIVLLKSISIGTSRNNHNNKMLGFRRYACI